MKKEMEYQPIYIATTRNKKVLKKHPLFKTKKEAWKYIQDNYCHCEMEIDPNKKGYCNACEAEWTIQVAITFAN